MDCAIYCDIYCCHIATLTIRKTLLAAFLLVSLLPSTLLTYLAFRVAGDGMRQTIEQNLQEEATTVSENIDKMLFERLQNAQTWRRLEVTQDIQIGDIDKRLSKFLTELKAGYQDVYLELLCTDSNGQIIASSHPASIGSVRHASAGIALSQDAGSAIRLENLQFDSANDKAALPISTNIPSQFGGGMLGELYLVFNWAQIYRILDQAALGGNDLVLLDHSGRIIAASAELRKKGVLLHPVPADWFAHSKSGVNRHNGAPFYDHEIMVGFEHSPGFQQFPGFNWITLVIENSQQAYVPVRQMALVFLLLLALTSTLAVSFSYLVAGRIAHPIAALTEFTRRFRHTQQLPDAPHTVGGEVGELTEAFVQTVQELDQSRANLVRASKLAVLGELAAVMAHEIRTPIGILRSSAQMLSREPNLSTEAKELTGFIESETERLNRLVSTLLDSARPRAPKLQPNDVHLLIQHCIDLLATQADKKGITIHQHLEAQNVVLELDAEQMTQVLLNLLLNALQILPPAGQIEISTRVSADRVVIDIADNGPGIAVEETSRVFDPFFTKREGGVGLGLAVVQQIVAAHGGEIHAGKSALGGALFTLTLPIKEDS